jgi:hypothetical protein
MRPHSPALRQMLRLALVAPLWGLISSRRRPSPGEAQAPSTPVALAPTPMDRALPDWRGVTLRANRWRTEAFNPSYWSEPKLGPYAWSLRNAVIKNGVLRLKVTEKASSQIQAWDRAFATRALWEVDVTLPTMAPGLIAAPLWSYNRATLEESDFEVVGVKGLYVTLWAKIGGQHVAVWDNGGAPIITGDLSGQRLRLGMAYEAGRSVVYFLNGREVARATPANTRDGHFPTGPQKVYLDLWVAAGIDPGWAGVWRPMRDGQSVEMAVHGYRQI